MVELSGGYFGTPFKGYCGVTQGDSLSPTIFNVVGYAVLQQSVTVKALAEEAVDHDLSRTDGFRRDVQHLSEYFYADNGILVSTWVACLFAII